MRITFFTPPVIEDDNIFTSYAHLTEHIVGLETPVSMEDYFAYIQDTNQEVYQTYTVFEFEGNDRLAQLQKLSEPLHKATYEYEKSLFIEEINARKDDYLPGLATRLSKLLYGKNYKGDSGKLPSFNNLSDYHKSFYNKSNCIVSDKNDKIVFAGSLIKTRKNTGKGTITYHTIKKGINNIHCICFSYSSSKIHRLAFFVGQLLEAYGRYTQRYQDGLYYYNKPEFFQTLNHIVISYSGILEPSEDFFELFKRDFLATYGKKYDNYRQIVDMIHGLTPLSKQEYNTLIKDISFEQCKEIISKKE